MLQVVLLEPIWWQKHSLHTKHFRWVWCCSLWNLHSAEDFSFSKSTCCLSMHTYADGRVHTDSKILFFSNEFLL